MALNKQKLQSDLEDTFSSMLSEDVTDDVFADGIASAFKDFCEGAEVITEDTGTVASPAGTFTGKGTGMLTADTSSCSSKILKACQEASEDEEGGDSTIAQGITDGLQAMLDGIKVETDLTGAITTSSAVITGVTGKAEGSITVDVSSLTSYLEDIFSSMKKMSSGGDSYFASQMATKVYTLVSDSVVATEAKEDLTGVTGSGTIS